MAIARVAVIGAGNMGSGIAQAFAQAGFDVTLNDQDAAAIERGLARLRAPLEQRVAAGKTSAAEVASIFARLTPEPDLAKAVASADLVVEAVFEDLKVKKELFARLDKACPPGAVLATNTSSLLVRDLAGATKRPGSVVGLHFFFPANINRLVEVIKGPATSPAAYEAAYAAAARAGKVPITTADAPGFCVNRFFVPWINEACRLLDEKVADVPTIEAAAKQAFGIAMGPFELMNVTGVPISLHAQSTLHAAFGRFYEPAASLRAQVATKRNWDLVGAPDPSRFDAVAARLRGVAFGIAARLVEEGVATAKDTDKGATVGLRWAQGPFALMNAVGTARALAEVEAVHARWGDAFPVAAELRAAAQQGRPFRLPAVAWEKRGDTALVTFDRPEALNALNEHVLRDLDGVLDEVERARPRAVVLTGSGKAFIAGADIPTMKALGPDGAQAYTELGNRVLDRLAGLDAPVIVAVNGYAFGGGLELALCGDLIVAADDAKLGLPEVGLGIHPGFGGTQRLPRRVGLGHAKDLVLTGRTVDAQEAKAMGLVNAVVPRAGLLDHALKLAADIAAKAPLAVASAKRMLDGALATPLPEGLRREQESVVLLFASKDKDEGLGAFLERRAPRFEGR